MDFADARPLMLGAIYDKRIMKLSVFAVLLLVSLAGCRSVNYSALVADANRTTADFYADENRDKSLHNIPKEYWVGEVKNLNPILFYHDRVNMVLVGKKFKNDEEGLYIMPYHSSYIPTNNEEWAFEHVEGEVYQYKRTRKAHNH